MKEGHTNSDSLIVVFTGKHFNQLFQNDDVLRMLNGTSPNSYVDGSGATYF